MTGSLTPEQANREIMKKLEAIENRIEKVEKRIHEITNWFWPIIIGGLLGWFWDDIIRFFSP